MSEYKILAADFINRKSITDIDDITGVVIYMYLKEIEYKIMAKYHTEANAYCYQLINGDIGTLPKCSVDRITSEVIGLN
jgi:hypothetical protein